MPRRSFEVDIKPKILIWARESIGINAEDIAKRLNVSKDTIKNWELGKKKPTLVQIKELSKIYKRPLGVFFLSEPPAELPLPKDFRSLSSKRGKPFSVKTILAIRRARRLQSLAIELAKVTNNEITLKITKITQSDDPEIISKKIRDQLGVKIQTQYGWKNEYVAFKEWRKVIENLGILVFQISMPIEETRGFSLAEGNIPVIVLNEKDSIRARIFSLFHEYGHLLLDKGGLCDMKEQTDLLDETMLIEKFCNHFAGAILVPKDALKNHRLLESTTLSTLWSDENLKKLSKDFKVSQEVILRRLLMLKLTSLNFYQKKREEWETITKKEEKQIIRRRQKPHKKCIQENGVPMVSLVLESFRKDKITYSDVSDYLAIQLKHLPKVEQLIESAT
jgi:Zn-dependent peptidase ImmA (M78 family)/DNA-binding XRE family transcriptional regulator